MHFLRHLATIPLCGFLIFVQPSRAQVITTIAGGEWLFRGDGGLASKAPLGSIKALGRDSNGNIYICDAGNHMVLKMTPAGTIHVVAGNGFNRGLGAGGFSGDGGPAVNAALYNPTGVAADAAGNLYICDRYNHRIRKVTPAGVITTVAGGGANDPGDGGPATAAVLKYPNSIALDASGNLYIADTNHDSIRRVAPDGTIATYAGGGQNDPSGGWPATSVALPMPRNITIDSAGNMYVSYSSRIAKIDAAGTTSAFAGVSSGESQASPADGPAKKVKLEAPCGLSTDTAGNLYFVDAFSELVRRVGTDGMLTTIAGDGFHAQAPSGECGLGRFRGDGGPARQASFDFCGSNGVFYWAGDVVAAPDGSIYVADTNNHRVRQVDTGGSISTAAGNNYFRYSGDLAPATSAGLNLPQAVAVDAAGNVLVADTENRRIRKIAPGGVMTTVAGSGVEGYSGDGGPAVQASIDEIRGLAVDPAGNLLLADAWAHVIRSVAPDGTITTVAGLNHLGGADASGDGGPATLAYLQGPEGVAADTSGNIFIADKLNWRVRKVAPSGVISTFAGGGSQSADGVPATSALLRQPAGVLAAPDGSVFIADDLAQKIRKVDSTGTITTVAGTGVIGFSGDGGGAVDAKLNSPRSPALGADGSLYFADEGSNRIRRIAPGGVIQTVAGNGTFNYSGDGGAATEASLASPSGIAVDSAGNLYIADWSNNRIRKVLGAPPSYQVAPASLKFTALSGSPATPEQAAAIVSVTAGLQWSATISASWLSLGWLAGTAPGVVSVRVDASRLSPGIYNGTITVTAPLAANPVQTVVVELTVLRASEDRPELDSSSMTFETTTGGANPQPRVLRIANSGSGSLNWTASAQTFNGANWLSLSPTSGTASAGSPSPTQVATRTAGLAPGIYSGLITVTTAGSSQPQTVTVDLIVSQVAQTVALTQTAMNFTAAEGDTADLRQPLGIINTGLGTMNWTARAKTMDGGNWIGLSAGSGQSEAGSVIVSMTDVIVNAKDLREGSYSALVQVDAPGANNSPRLVTVTLQVRPAGSKTAVQLQPQALIFSARAGGGSPGSRTVTLTSGGVAGIEARGTVFTQSGGEWLKVLPTNLVVSSSDPRSIVVQPFVTSLAAGEYRGALTFQFSDNSTPQAVEVYFLVVSNPVQTASRAAGDELAAGCARQKIVAVSRTQGANFAASVGTAQPLEMQVMDDCGAAVTDATVVASFSNGERPVTLRHVNEGIYSGEWRPTEQIDAVTVTLAATAGTLPTVEVLRQGRVDAGTAAMVFPGGMVNAASYASGAVAPGSLVSVFGQNMASGSAGATQVPLPKTLAGASVQIGGVDIPLFYSSTGQINAQVPFELQAGTRPQVVVKVGNRVTVPETITIAPGRPGIFSRNMDGQGQGMITDAITYAMFDASNPAKAGDYAAIYCTGLGRTDLAVPSGERAPLDKLANTIVPVQVSIGGQPATVSFAGLAPGWVGLYQVNVQIPTGVTSGSSVLLVITQNGISSNIVTLAVR